MDYFQQYQGKELQFGEGRAGTGVEENPEEEKNAGNEVNIRGRRRSSNQRGQSSLDVSRMKSFAKYKENKEKDVEAAAAEITLRRHRDQNGHSIIIKTSKDIIDEENYDGKKRMTREDIDEHHGSSNNELLINGTYQDETGSIVTGTATKEFGLIKKGEKIIERQQDWKLELRAGMRKNCAAEIQRSVLSVSSGCL